MALSKIVNTEIGVPATYHRIEEISWIKENKVAVYVRGYAETNVDRKLGTHIWDRIYTFPSTASEFDARMFEDYYVLVKTPIMEPSLDDFDIKVDVNPLTGAEDLI